MEMWPNLTLRLAGKQYLPLHPVPAPPLSAALCSLFEGGGLGKIQSAQLFDKLQRQRTQQEKRLKLFMNSQRQRRRLGFSSRLDLDSTRLGLALGLATLLWQAARQAGRTCGQRTADRVSLWAKLITWSLSSYEVSFSLSSLFYVVDIMRNFSLVTLIEGVVNPLSLGQGSWEYYSRVWIFVGTTKEILAIKWIKQGAAR